jgi:hypothetical protein
MVNKLCICWSEKLWYYPYTFSVFVYIIAYFILSFYPRLNFPICIFNSGLSKILHRILMPILHTTQLFCVVFFVFIIQVMFYKEYKLYIMNEIVQLCNIFRFYPTFFFNKTNRRTNFPNLFCQETLHVSGSSSAHHKEFSTVHSTLVYVMQVWWYIQVSNVQWKTPDDGQRNCPTHVEFLDKINLVY